MEHKLNELSGSIQHSLALGVLASPPAFSVDKAYAVSGQRPHRRLGTCCSDRLLLLEDIEKRSSTVHLSCHSGALARPR